MKKKLTVALVSHIIKDDNLGCGALAISNIKLIDEVFKRKNVEVSYVVAITDNLTQIDMSKYTANNFEYRVYPRCRQTLRNPFLLLRTKVFDGCDLVINLCGGDGYADIYGFGRLLAESQLALLGKLRKTPVVYAPQTIGPFATRKGRLVAKVTLGKVNHIFVRDHASYNCCENLGLQKKTTEVIDVAFALPFNKQIRSNNHKQIGINVSGLLYYGGYDRKNYFGLSFSYKEFIEKLLFRLCSIEGVNIHLIPHVNSDTNEIEDDYVVCKKLAQKYNCILAPRYDSPIDVKNYISGMDLFSGARMHSTIGAISSGVPVIPVAYSRKFNGLYGSLEYPWLIDAKAEIDVDQAIDLFFEYMSKIDQMQESVVHAEKIYLSRLEQYQKYISEILGKLHNI